MNKTLALLLLLASIGILSAQNFIDATVLETRTKAQLSAEYGLPVPYGAIYVKIRYSTPDVFGQTDTASGLLVMPDDLTQIYPLGVYMHGTVSNRFEVPSRGEYEVTPVLAAFGYIGLAPDYLGLGDARGLHPYVHAATEASAGVDMILAAKAYLDQQGWMYNDQLFISGYSQGGHAGAALHRELEKNHSQSLPVTAAVHMSGPYSISGVMRNLILIDSAYSRPSFIANAFLSYNMVYDLYVATDEVFKQPYASLIDQYKSSAISGNGVFDLDQLNDSLGVLLTASHGGAIPMYMLQDSVLLAMKSNPNHQFNVALRANDLLDWAPQAPTRLLYCSADEQVPYQNALVADSALLAQGATQLAIFNINPNLSHRDCVEPSVINMIFFFAGFQQITTGLEDFTDLDVRIYPNPASDVLTIEQAPVGSRLELWGVQGQLLLSMSIENSMQRVNLSPLPKGLLLLRLQHEDQSLSRRILHR